MIALLLAASLSVQAEAACAREPFGSGLVWYALPAAADLGSTAYCLHRNPDCVEASGTITGVAIAEIGAAVALAVIDQRLREQHKHVWWLRALYAIKSGLVVTLNVHNSRR